MEQEMRQWHRERWAEQAIKNLRKNYFAASYVEGAKDALALIMTMLPPEAEIGLGDSLTLKEIGVIRAMEERGTNFLNPWHL